MTLCGVKIETDQKGSASKKDLITSRVPGDHTSTTLSSLCPFAKFASLFASNPA